MDLKLLTQPFVQEETNRIEVKFDSQTSCQVFWLDPRPSDPDWGPIIGDVLYNLRSSLDQFANALVEVNSRQPTTKTEFPVFKDPTDFLCRAGPKIARMSDAARTFVEDAQPYKRMNRPEYDWLWLVHDLGNEDKHRNLHLTVSSVKSVGHYGEADIVSANFGPVNSRTPIMAVRVSGPEMNVPMQFTLEIAFDKARRWGMAFGVESFLRACITSVDDLFSDAVAQGLIIE